MSAPRHGHGSRHRTGTGSVLLRSAALGVAAGSRASLGVAGPVLSSGAGRLTRWPAVLGVVGELTGDKLPSTPSRLDPPGPSGRAVSAATGAVVLARRARRPVWSAALIAAAASTVGTWGGAAWRSRAARRGPDWRGALVEDAVAITLATLAWRESPRR
ncbi:hypothetical protein [Cellulomonas sp. RIT-PI-Y]|uniref:hypothetical protein n=1 Tax=Cellulomonas sp. RIT-PI-Y TaxID=3035297 RepID=UPI0021DA87AD|nr:hypothetical protein [Cellulomonas sp. RIT-PI-Y]